MFDVMIYMIIVSSFLALMLLGEGVALLCIHVIIPYYKSMKFKKKKIRMAVKSHQFIGSV